jgi:hypothetical protein
MAADLEFGAEVAEVSTVAVTSTDHQHDGEHAELQWLDDSLRLPGELPHFYVGHHDANSGDWYPDVAAMPTVVAPAGHSLWSDWASNLTAKDVVYIPEGSHVVYDADSSNTFKAIGIAGTLEFAIDRSTKLTVGTILIYPDGGFYVGVTESGERPAQPVRSTVVFDGVVNVTEDPTQMTVGLIATGGKVHIEGDEVQTAFAELSAPAAAGSQTLQFAVAPDWQPGDRLVLADTQVGGQAKNFQSQWEEVEVAAVDGGVVRLTAPLQYAHVGYVGQISRNIVFRSADGAGTADQSRGHMLFGGDTQVTVRSAAFVNLGRTKAEPINDTRRGANGQVILDDQGQPVIGTNQRGRYNLHAHHLTEAAVFENIVIDGALKWGLALHGTYSEIRDSVAVRFEGAAFASEDGNEIGVVERNLTIGTGGGTGIADNVIVNASPGEAKNNSFGHGGFGFWFASPLMHVRDNVAAGQYRVDGFAYWLFGREGMRLPVVAGANPDALVGISANVLAGKNFNPSYQPVVEFARNRADVALGHGFVSYYSNANHWAVDQFHANIRSLNAKGVHFYYSAPRTYPRADNQSVINSVLIGPYALGLDPNTAPARPYPAWQGQLSLGIDGDPTGATPIVHVRDSQIVGFYDGIITSRGGMDIERVHLQNFRNIGVPYSVFPSVQVNIIDVTYADLSNAQHPQELIYLDDDVTYYVKSVRDNNNVNRLNSWLTSRTEVRVYNHNGTDRDFQVYFEPQRPDYVIPILEMTNQQAQDRYGISIGDALAPAGSEPQVVGRVGPIQPILPGVRYNPAVSTKPDLNLEYVVKHSYGAGDPPAVRFTEAITLQPGLNFITREIPYEGSVYKKTFVIWGQFPGAVRGDADGNQRVDYNDFQVWLRNAQNLSGTATLSQGDFSGDGNVDLTDLQIWIDEFLKIRNGGAAQSTSVAQAPAIAAALPTDTTALPAAAPIATWASPQSAAVDALFSAAQPWPRRWSLTGGV